LLAAAGLITLSPATTQAAHPAPTKLPTGGQVVAAQAAIAQTGAAMTINQASQRAAIDWQSFNLFCSVGRPEIAAD